MRRARQRSRPAVLVMAVGILVAAFAVACSSDDTTETSTDQATTAPAASGDGTTVAGTTFEVWFLADGGACDEVVAAQRRATGDPDIEVVLDELLAGPTPEEAAQGMGGWFSEDTAGMLRSARVEDGTASVDLDPALPDVIPNASSSCGSTGLLAQLDATVTQLPGVDDAVYSLGGDVDAFYLWLQLAPPTTR